ncbi:MAG: outer membrane protein assembly factor BamA [Thermodesulfobacteriota bacterium]|jgi:outer membrane protein assembly complex protein YaeT
MMRIFLFMLACWVPASSAVFALSVEELDQDRQWRVTDIRVTGNEVFSEDELLSVLLTKERAWYLPWRERPAFDPVTFTTDVERLRRFYEARGYYQARVTYDLHVNERDALVTVEIRVEEGQPVTVAEVTVEVADPPPPPGGPAEPGPPPSATASALRGQLPLQPGAIFTEEAYQQSEQVIGNFFLTRGHAHVQTGRRAEVDLDQRAVYVRYTADPGPHAIFGETRIEGTEDVDPHLVRRELAYQPGEQFSLEKVEESRKRILDLGLFRSVLVAPAQTSGTPAVVPMRVRVEERPPRDLRVGLKYGTEDEFGGQVEWRHRNWFGGGRQLSLLLKLSSVTRTLNLTLIQPHFLAPRTRGVLSLRQDQDDEETYLLNATRLWPRLEHRFSDSLSGFVGYRLEWAKLNDVAPATIQALGGIRRDGVLSGPALGLVWNTTEDPFNPRQGGVLSFTADQAGEVWGGNFRFYKLTAEGKKYHRLGRQTVLAGRLKIGIADTFGAKANIPLYERFYAGGEKSVRGYGRRRLGPLSAADDPLGGLSLVEGSVELRRPLWRALGGALFLDFGQVALDAFDIPVDDLKFAAGVGVSYATPVGPLRLDIGFPFDPPRGDQAWQVHFSIGQFF